jgi:hypothetical protein
MLVPYGLNPDETWELDFAAARAKHELAILAATEKALRDDAARKGGPDAEALLREADAVKASADALRAELDTYTPRSGPLFTIGAIPNAMRAEIAGERQEIDRMPPGPERERRDVALAEKVIRWTVRGHEQLRTRSGASIPFVSDPLPWEGRTRTSPARATLEAYQPILHDLSLHALRSQRLDEAGKNG